MPTLLDEMYNIATGTTKHKTFEPSKEQDQNEAYEYLVSNLNGKLKEQFLKFEDATFDNLAETEEYFFNLGFKTGIMLMVETLNAKD